MANLIPNIVPSGTPSSEERIFKKLKNDSGTVDWTVMHSLGLSQRGKKKPYGEIDFVIVIPGLGVVCLEIKGGQEISCKAGRWYTTDRHGQIHEMKKSPFIQVREGMNALRNSILDDFGPSFKKCNFYTLVVFPSSDCPPITPEFRQDEVIDSSVLGKSISSLIVKNIKSQCKRFDWTLGQSLRDASEQKKLINFLRPDFELKISRPARIRRDKEDLIALTREQFKFIEGCSENKRCLVKGAAGTGKTTLAIEALKLIESDDKRGAFLCFNNVFGGWVQKELETLKIDCAYAGGIYEAMVALIKESSFYSEYCEKRNDLSSKELFEKLIPKFAMEAILETGDQLDYIIVDEGQDILKPHILEVIDIWLRGGLKKGNWFIFGDFNNQAIYSADLSGSDLIACLEEYVSSYAAFKLNQNCRNTKRIAESTSHFSGFLHLPYTVSQIEGEPVHRTFYKNQKEANQKLSFQIEKLIEEGCLPAQITVLSPKKFSASSASNIQIDGHKIVDVSNASNLAYDENAILFSTIHSFKGLESPIVLLTDIESIQGHYNSSLLYIGMSRASVYLSLLMKESARAELKENLSKAIQGGNNGQH